MVHEPRGWVEVISSNDAEALWSKLFKLISRHSSIRSLLDSKRSARDRRDDFYCDMTQDLFLRLYQKDRLRYYIAAGHSNSDIEHELYHIEIPNLVSLILRERHPEAYRLVRRISDLLQTNPAFQRFRKPDSTDGRKGKLAIRNYGLIEWPLDKPMRPTQTMSDLVANVPTRLRDRRRAGRASSSQIIISNVDLTDLLKEIFRAIDSPADIRVLRSLVLSKLPVEDSRFVSIDAAITSDYSSDPEPISPDFADKRPTPEQVLLELESKSEADAAAEHTLSRLRAVVRNKPRRYRRLVTVVWHCYFDNSSPSQTHIARMIGISGSLVSYYRKLFESVIRDVQLDTSQYVPFLHSFGARLQTSISETDTTRDESKIKSFDTPAQSRHRASKPVRAMRAVSGSS